MEAYILLSILAFSFSCGAICTTVAGYFYLRYSLLAVIADKEHLTDTKLREQAEYLRQVAQEDAFNILKEGIQSTMNQGDKIQLGNFANFGM